MTHRLLLSGFLEKVSDIINIYNLNLKFCKYINFKFKLFLLSKSIFTDFVLISFLRYFMICNF